MQGPEGSTLYCSIKQRPREHNLNLIEPTFHQKSPNHSFVSEIVHHLKTLGGFVSHNLHFNSPLLLKFWYESNN